MAGNPGNVSTETINEVILRLLKLNSGTELDYQIYAKKLKIKLASVRMVGATIPADEDELLREEFKRVRNKTGRFKVKVKTAKVSTNIPPSPSSSSSGGKTSSRSGQIVKSPKGKITKEKYTPSDQVKFVTVKDVTEKQTKVSEKENPLEKINKTLDSILQTIISLGKENQKERDKKRKEDEQKRRDEKERGLESKSFAGIRKAVSAITKPFQSIFDKIFNFIFYTLLGRVVIKLIDWFADPKNKDKVNSLIRFVKDWWPALLGSYILFGTSFGKLITGLTGMVGRFIFQIGKVAIPQLLRFIRSPLGAGALLFTAGATIPAMFPGTVNQQERKTKNAPGTNEEKIKTLQNQKANLNLFERLQGKGSEIDEQLEFLKTGKTKSYGFAGGGYANYSNLLGGFSKGSLLDSMDPLLGVSEESSGVVSGPKGKDKVPAMLTDGEFVMSVGAVNKYGVETLEAMNAAGGGTNQPKVVGGKTYAAGGGFIGDVPINWLTSNMSDEAARSLSRSYSAMGSDSLGLSSDEWYNAFKRYKGVPDFDKLLGEGKPFTKWENVNKPLSKQQLDLIRQVVRGNNPGSAYHVPNPQGRQGIQSTTGPQGRQGIQSTTGPQGRQGIQSTMSALNRSQLRNPGSKLNLTIRTIPTGRMLPAAGGTSANAMREAEKASRLVREPIPASRAIVPYRGGGLVRTGITAGLSESIPQIRPNMKIPGGFGNLKTLGVELLVNYLVQKGIDKVTALMLANSIEKSKKLKGPERKNYIEKLRNVVEKEENWQRGFGGLWDKIIGLGRESSSEKKSNYARSILEGMGSSARLGGKIVGGYRLREQSFREAPKTQIMTDDRGMPFVGYKAMRNGKIVYVRGPQPGGRTSNPLEALGRMINPNAYRDIDAKNKRSKYEEAYRNSMSSLRARGASQATISRTRRQLSLSGTRRQVKPVTPLPSRRPRYIPAGGGMNGRRGSGSNPSSRQRVPSPSPRHPRGFRSASAYGIHR